MESLYHMMQQPENHIPDHSPQHIGQDIVHLKISPAGDQLDRLHTEAGHKCCKGITKKSPKPWECPGTDKSIGNKQQYIFHDKRMVPRIRPPGREQFSYYFLTFDRYPNGKVLPPISSYPRISGHSSSRRHPPRHPRQKKNMLFSFFPPGS